MSVKQLVAEAMGAKKKEQIPIYKAYFEDLIDIVLNDDEIKFLLSDGEVYDQRMIDGITYSTPPVTGLPPLTYFKIPRFTEIMKYAQNHKVSDKTDNTAVCKGCTQLYDDLLQYHKDISELPDNDYYHLLVLWDFHTYLIEKLNYSPIIYFYSVAERGKSRTLKGMIYVAYRGMRKGDIRDAQLIRDCTHLRASLAFDMMDFWEKVKQAGSQDVILNRYERGLIVSRVNRPEKGAFQDTDYYDVFGPTILATNEIIHDIADSRAISIVMQKADRDYDNDVTPELGLPLKEQLTAFRLVHFNDPLPIVPKLATARLGDITRPFYQILMKVNPALQDLYANLVKKIANTKLSDKASSNDAEIIKAMVKAQEESTHGKIASQLITNYYNEDKTEKEKFKSRDVANRLRSFGFQTATMANGALGFYVNLSILNKLIKEYGVHTLSDSESSDSSESSVVKNIKDIFS